MDGFCALHWLCGGRSKVGGIVAEMGETTVLSTVQWVLAKE